MTQVMHSQDRPHAAMGRKIREARQAAGLSQEKLADTAGTSRRHVMRLERGDHRPTQAMVKRLASATGKDESFFADSDDEEADPVGDLTRSLLALVRSAIREATA